MLNALFAGAVMAAFAIPAVAGQVPPAAIVVQDQVALRAAPRDSARQQAVLWQGESLEVRGERLDYLQVYDHRRERAGFVHASQVRRTSANATEAAELLSIVRFMHDTPGAEALGIGYVAAYFRAAAPEALSGDAGIEALDALGTFAERLARRASSVAPASKAAQAALAAQLEVAAAYGVRYSNRERDGRMHVCYDGEAFRRVLAMPSTPDQRARAALALTDPLCMDPDLGVLERGRMDEWRAGVLDLVDPTRLPAYLKSRLLARRSGLWGGIAYQQARRGEAPEKAAARAIGEFAAINKQDLTDVDLPAYNDAAMRVSASRWAAAPGVQPPSRSISIVTAPGQPGETCVTLVDTKAGALASRCTYGVVWAASATLNREANAFALAVQQTDTWRELWVFRQSGEGWSVRVVPPALSSPELGYAEFAGWVPGGRQVLVARESRSEGKYRRAFELVELDALAVERQAGDPGLIAVFQRWQDPAWKRQTLSLR